MAKLIVWALALLAIAFPAAAVAVFGALVAVAAVVLAHFTASCAVAGVVLLACAPLALHARRVRRARRFYGYWAGGAR